MHCIPAAWPYPVSATNNIYSVMIRCFKNPLHKSLLAARSCLQWESEWSLSLHSSAGVHSLLCSWHGTVVCECVGLTRSLGLVSKALQCVQIQISISLVRFPDRGCFESVWRFVFFHVSISQGFGQDGKRDQSLQKVFKEAWKPKHHPRESRFSLSILANKYCIILINQKDSYL